MSDTPNIHALEGVVAADILTAMRVASAEFRRLGIRHALVDGLAVGAYGWPRATKDVDFLIGPEGFEHHAGGIVTFASGVPLRVGRVPVDPLLAADDEPFMEAVLDAAPVSDGIPVVPIEGLVYMKLVSPRRKDEIDIIELAKTAGFDRERVFDWLKEHAADLVEKFEGILRRADEEMDEI